MSRGKNLWCHKKRLVIGNIYAKYESPVCYGKKVMCRVNVFQM